MTTTSTFMNGKTFAELAKDIKAGSNSAKTEQALKEAYAALSDKGIKKTHPTKKVPTPGYRHGKDYYTNQQISIAWNGDSVVMVSNRPKTKAQEVELDKAPNGAYTRSSFKTAIEHFKGVNGVNCGQYKFVDATTKAIYTSESQFFTEVIRPMNLEAIAAKKAALKSLGKVKA